MKALRATIATRSLIYLDNFRYNIMVTRKKAGPHPKICVPVKADAYGHGAVPLALCALEAGAEYLGVATVPEGLELRAAGISAPILLFTQALPEELPDLISGDLSPFISDLEFIEIIGRETEQANKNLNIHLKVDTGMGRNGCRPEDAALLAEKIVSQKRLNLSGVATHLSVSDSSDADDINYTKEQLRRFQEAVASIKKADIDPGLVHAANSGGLVLHDDSYFDMVRPGIFLYGYSPSKLLISKPVMELRSKVVAVKKVRKGEAVSYGRTWIAEEDTNIGIIPVGYADGLNRLLSNKHTVSIGGKAYPLAGRICMDQCMVNLGPEAPVQRWDEVIFFGPEFLNAGDIAEKLKTIPYEVTCGINKRVPRVYI